VGGASRSERREEAPWDTIWLPVVLFRHNTTGSHLSLFQKVAPQEKPQEGGMQHPEAVHFGMKLVISLQFLCDQI